MPQVECDTWSIFKQNTVGLNSEFSFSWTNFFTKANEPSLCYLPIATERRYGFMPFPKVLVGSEMQTTLSKSIIYSDNCYTVCMYGYVYIYI